MIKLSFKKFKIIEFYFSKKLNFIFILGIASGIPLYLVLSTLIIWLTRENIDLSTIGLFTLTQIPWTIKFLWAPIIDFYKIPILSNLIGKRKSWLILAQFLLVVSIVLIGVNDPKENLLLTAFLAFLIAFFSATQDIIIDALRIELLSKDQQGAGAAMTQAGYRVGGILAGAGCLYLREIMSWQNVFLIVGLFIIVLSIFSFFIPEPHKKKLNVKNSKNKNITKHISIFFDPILEFFDRNLFYKIFFILLLILLYKFGDVVAGVMANPFYVKLGFSNIEIANASKLFGVIATLIGVFIGGWLVKKYGILNSLIVGSILQILSNLLFVALSNIGPNYLFLIITVAGENISGGLGSSAFVAYLSVLCNKKYTATQYALLSSIMGIARTFLSSPSGFLVNYIGWTNFFLYSTIFGIPGLIILFWMSKKLPIDDQISKIQS